MDYTLIGPTPKRTQRVKEDKKRKVVQHSPIMWRNLPKGKKARAKGINRLRAHLVDKKQESANFGCNLNEGDGTNSNKGNWNQRIEKDLEFGGRRESQQLTEKENKPEKEAASFRGQLAYRKSWWRNSKWGSDGTKWERLRSRLLLKSKAMERGRSAAKGRRKQKGAQH